MEFDFSKLRGRIYEKFGNVAACAPAAGMTEAMLYARLSNRVPITLDEACDLAAPECLDIAAEEIPAYFFNRKVQ